MKKYSFVLILIYITGFVLQTASADDHGRVRLPDELKILDAKSFQASQSFAKSNSAWTQFVSVNDSWEVWWNDLSKTPHRAWGKGIPTNGFNHITQANAADAGWRFVNDYANVLNANPSELRLLQSEEANGKWYFKFKQRYKGLDVLNTVIDLRMMPDGRVFMFGSDFIQGIDVNINPAFSKDAAMEFAKVGLNYFPGSFNIEGGDLYILPLKFDDRIDNRLVYNFIIHESDAEVWNTYIDAHDGNVLWRYNLVYDFASGEEIKKANSVVTGQVKGQIYPLSYSVDSAVVAFPNQYININGKELTTDANGNFSIDIGSADSLKIISCLAGPWAVAKRLDSSITIKNAQLNLKIPKTSQINITWDNTNSSSPERNAFFNLTKTYNFIRNIDTSSNLSDLDKQLPGYVNFNSTCNARWIGSGIQFFKEDATCPNTALIAGVAFHEYGHGINQFLYTKRRGQPMMNGALNEATADINANMMEDDPRIGVGFLKGKPNNGIIRNADNNFHYPEDLAGEIHIDGQILTGAVWDMRKAIGLDVSRRITHFAKYGTPDASSDGEAFADYFFELLAADDDDGNLTNGTPHSADIIPAFVKHGIPASGVSIAHNPIKDQDSSGNGYRVTGGLTVAIGIGSNRLWAQSTQIIYSLDNWSTQFVKELKMATKTRFDDTLAAQQGGSIVRYYLNATDNYGGTQRKPNKAPSQSYIFLIGYDSKIFDNVEKPDNWSINPDNDDKATRGTWVRGVPKGINAQPFADHSPGAGDSTCWITGVASMVSPNISILGGKTSLQTIVYDLSSFRVPVIRYWRSFTSDQGTEKAKTDWLVQISNDDGKTWKDLERTQESIVDWTARAFKVREYVQPTDKVRVRFTASNTNQNALVQAAVDDFEILDLKPNISGTENIKQPYAFDLRQNYPNPTMINGMNLISIPYSLPIKAYVTLKVYNTFGQEIQTLVASEQNGGMYTVQFDASNLNAGVYLYELRVGNARLTKKMICIR